MASIYLRGRMWYICYYQNGLKVDKSLKTRDKTTAKYKKNEIENKLTVGDAPMLQKDTPAKLVYEEFIKRCRLNAKPATVVYYKEIITPFLNSLPDNISIQKIKPQTVDRYIDGKIESGKVSPGMVWHLVKALKTFFNFARKARVINENPVTRKKPRLPKKPPEVWTPDEIKRILEYTESTLSGRMIRFNLYVGLRPAEMLRLKWEDIDFAGQTLTVQEAKDNEFRKLNLHPVALQNLKELRQSGHRDSEAVFKGVTLSYMDYWARKVKKGLSLGHIKRFWYAIRHTFATTYYEKTRDLRGLQEMLGHSKIEMTTVYVNPSEEHRREQIRKLDYKL